MSKCFYKITAAAVLLINTLLCTAQSELIQWVEIPGGSFMMGSPENEPDRRSDEKQHLVRVKPFLMSKYEITVAAYRAYCEETGEKMPAPPTYGWQENAPIANITYYEAMQFAKHEGCRLPTEEEWEYACRAGTNTAYWFGNTIPENSLEYLIFNIDIFDNQQKEALLVDLLGTERKANPFGLVDMHGGVSEWCSNKYAPYPGAPIESTDNFYICRGGNYAWDKIPCRSAYRDRTYAFTHSYNRGIRLVCDYIEPVSKPVATKRNTHRKTKASSRAK